ncbi:MAG: TonB-dependent receptor plug domain-containing protein [Opitutaceae bacterium]|nr:TonB-dependent receptor plug domain-containing protein [Opitutaceae bacterium]
MHLTVTHLCRGLLARCLIACTTSLTGVVALADEPGAGKDILELSKFEVLSTQDKGYIANNTATGFKTKESLMRIPQSVTVVTRDLIEDIGAVRTSDVLQFAGASQFYRGESIRLRGARALNPYIDDTIDNTPYMDNIYIDSYEVIRGPAGVLYANSSVGGVVLKATKKPLPFNRRTLSFSVNDWGQYRGEYDFTGPAGSIGDAKLSYRLTGAYQDGDAYFKNTEDQRLAVHPTLQVELGNTTARFALDYQDITQISHGMSIIAPDGTLYVGAGGRKQGGYPKNAMEDHVRSQERITLLHRFSDNWEAKLFITHLDYQRQGSVLLNNAVNFADNTLRVTARRNFVHFNNWIINQDFLGKYHIGWMENQSAMGFTLTDEINRAANTADSVFGTKTLSLSNPDLDSIVLRTYSSYAETYPLGVNGSWTNNRRSTYYYSHQATVIPDRLILVGGLTQAGLQVNDIPSYAAKSTIRIVHYDELLHRYGLVFNVTKDIALYALKSTTFAPQGNSNTRDYYGILLPAQQGSGKEVGVKTALLDGKLSSTLSFFDMDLTNVPVAGIGISPITNASYSTAEGLQRQKGVDGTLSWAINPDWQILVTGYKGTVTNQSGSVPNGTYTSMYSFFTRYDFTHGVLKGLSVGGGASKTDGNILLVPATGYTLPAGVTQGAVYIKPDVNATMFVTYRHGKHWTFRLNIANVLDENLVMGTQGLVTTDPSPPRTFTFSTLYRF